MRQKRLTPEEVRRREAHDDRCDERHPNWRFVRCERRKDTLGTLKHETHHAEGRSFEWVTRGA